MQTVLKILLAAVLIVAATEVAKRTPRIGGLILSLPLTSIIALTWLYATDRSAEKVATLAWSTLWFVIPSLLFFIVLPLLLRRGFSFPAALPVAAVVTAGAYAIWPALLLRCGIKL
jgi:uncharacterized membrane protein (GlpM family)